MSPALPFGPDYGFGLYIHWPYCSRICPYCDFNVYAAKDRDSAPLVNAILADLARHKHALGAHPKLQSVYFGGGTPSLLSSEDIGRLISAADSAFGLDSDVEITLEANPNDVLKSDVEGWAAAGVNRLSIGLQSLNDDALRFLGRDHDAASARRAIELAARQFPNHSIDLIYARPGQAEDAWAAELSDALALGAPHLSLYELTIEERTAFGKRAARGELVPMPDDDQADLYELTQEICEGHGLPAYEVSNHARALDNQSKHNLIYWRGGDWIGLGPGAHGRLTFDSGRIATLAPLRPDDYSAAVARTAGLTGDMLSPIDSARELLALGLRPSEGLNPQRIEALVGAPLDNDALGNLIETGFVHRLGERIALTANGRLLADRIAAELSP